MRLGILISGRGSNMEALIRACAEPGYPAKPAVVISNKADAKGLAIAADMGVPTRVVPHRDYASREEFEKAVDAVLREHDVSLVCLAGFMRVLTPWLIGRWDGRLINIHPSLLPEFPGLDTHARAIAAGKKEAGCSVHLVVPEVDAGPILLQAKVPVLADDTEAALAARVLGVEHVCYKLAVKWFAEGRYTITNGKASLKEKPSGMPEGFLIP